MSQAPGSATETRSRHFGAIMRGRSVAYGVAFGLLAVVAVAILLARPIALAGAPAVALLIVAIAFVVAGKRAATDFYTAFAASHGFDYYPRYDLVAFTPLLGAGDRRHASNYMSGPLGKGDSHGCVLTHYTFEVREEGHNSDADHWEPYDFTVCCVDLGSSAEPSLKGIYLVERLGLFGKFQQDNWLRRHKLRKTELESSQFHERFDLFVEPDQDEIALRQLFAPSLIEWFANHPLEPGIECRAGMLVVYVDRHVEDAAHLQWLLDATRDLVKRFEAFGQPSAAAA